MGKKLIYFFLVLNILGCLGYHYLAFQFQQSLDKATFEQLMLQIKHSEELPKHIYSAYEEQNPHSLTNNFLKSIINSQECPSKLVSQRIYPIVISKHSIFHYYFLIQEIEKQSSQKQCFNWLAQEFDFLYSNRGMRQASLFYFKKDLEHISIDEARTLIKMLDNPIKYNPLKK